MKYKTRPLKLLEGIRTKVNHIHRGAERNLPFDRDEFITFTNDLLNSIDEAVDLVSLENDDQLRYTDNLV